MYNRVHSQSDAHQHFSGIMLIVVLEKFEYRRHGTMRESGNKYWMIFLLVS